MATTATLDDSSWVSREIEAMVGSWKRGEEATAKAIIERADLDSEAAIRLIYEETSLRREAGQTVDTAEVVALYPRWADEIRALFECDRLIQSHHERVRFPEVGETLGPFLLLEELGRGASGRTYLASDPTLANRPVVVKIIPDDQDEHLALARLRHTHIVPLFSEHSFAETGLRGLCMPFLGGASLSQILDDLRDVPLESRTGRLLVKVIDRHARKAAAEPRDDGPFRRSLEQVAFVQAMTWITSCLADALHYAHARGLVHMDIKPSNVLITGDGQPMLLDFHLAHAPLLAGESVTDRLGGTPGWMSPEQESAMTAVSSGRSLAVGIDGRSDIYALGLLLCDALGVRDKLDDRRADVSLGIRDLLRKCLASDPDDRYRDAAMLAEDLRRELNDLPLRGVRNRSPRERWRKWRRRHPGRLAWGVVGLVVLSAVAIAFAASFAAYGQMVGQMQSLLEDGQRDRADGQYESAIRNLDRGRKLAGSLPISGDFRAEFSRELRLAERGRLAEGLHELCDRVRLRHGVDLPGHGDGRALADLCRGVWDRRGEFLENDGPTLPDELERQIRTDLIELAAIQADLRIHLAPSDDKSAKRAALQLLNEAETLCGSSFAIEIRRENLGGVRNRAEGGHVPTSSWEHDEQGRYELRNGRVESAAEEFRLALDDRPQDFWPNFYHGLCEYRRKHYDAAVADFQACIAIHPEVAAGHYNRALAYEALGRPGDARNGYTKALAIDPFLVAARLNRGVLLYKEGRNGEAIVDFEEALKTRPDRETGGRLYFNMALAYQAMKDSKSARANAEKAAELGCREASGLSERLP